MNFRTLAYAPLALSTVFLSAPIALAQTSGDDFSDAARVTPQGGTEANGQAFSDLVNQGFIIFTWVAGIAAIFYLLISGFQYITAGGDGEKAAKARTGIINAIIGIIILMAAFFIFNAARNAGGGVSTGDVGNSL